MALSEGSQSEDLFRAGSKCRSGLETTVSCWLVGSLGDTLVSVRCRPHLTYECRGLEVRHEASVLTVSFQQGVARMKEQGLLWRHKVTFLSFLFVFGMFSSFES